MYNSEGCIYRIDLETKEITKIDTDFVNDCNNDHVLSADGTQLAVSHATKEDGKSRIYTLPITGGVPRLITPLAPSYLHGWSPDGKTLVYCAERNGDYDIYTIPAEGGVETRLTDAPGLDDGSEYDSVGEYMKSFIDIEPSIQSQSCAGSLVCHEADTTTISSELANQSAMQHLQSKSGNARSRQTKRMATVAYGSG